MKKIIIMLSILLIPAFSLQAKVKLGVKGGVNLANASFSTEAIKTDNFTGYQIGPILEFSGVTGFEPTFGSGFVLLVIINDLLLLDLLHGYTACNF